MTDIATLHKFFADLGKICFVLRQIQRIDNGS